MNLRHVTTDASVWIFDLDLMRYLRMPRTEGPAPSAIPYAGNWDAFTAITREGVRLCVHRPVPFGTGALRLTGRVLSDTHDMAAWPPLEHELDEETAAERPLQGPISSTRWSASRSSGG